MPSKETSLSSSTLVLVTERIGWMMDDGDGKGRESSQGRRKGRNKKFAYEPCPLRRSDTGPDPSPFSLNHPFFISDAERDRSEKSDVKTVV
jgi:hypothetical protein